MIDDIRAQVDLYAAWLRDKTTFREINGWVEITTPYLDRHNDYLQIYVKTQDSSTYILTDDGYVIRDLEQSGCSMSTPKRQSLLKVTLNGFGVRLDRDHLEVTATADNFAIRKHNLVQAMLAVNDLFYMAEPFVASLFFEDVVSWLDVSNIRYTPQVKFTGRSGYDHLFDFVIPKSQIRQERLLRAITRPSRDTAQSFAFAWEDTKEIRPSGSSAYALLNDTEHPVSPDVVEALKSYDINPVMWRERELIRSELAA